MASGLTFGRIADALIGLHDGSAQIGGTEARGVYDNPVVAYLYDLGWIEPLPHHTDDGARMRWGLTALGRAAAAAQSSVREKAGMGAPGAGQ